MADTEHIIHKKNLTKQQIELSKNCEFIDITPHFRNIKINISVILCKLTKGTRHDYIV